MNAEDEVGCGDVFINDLKTPNLFKNNVIYTDDQFEGSFNNMSQRDRHDFIEEHKVGEKQSSNDTEIANLKQHFSNLQMEKDMENYSNTTQTPITNLYHNDNCKDCEVGSARFKEHRDNYEEINLQNKFNQSENSHTSIKQHAFTETNNSKIVASQKHNEYSKLKIEEVKKDNIVLHKTNADLSTKNCDSCGRGRDSKSSSEVYKELVLQNAQKEEHQSGNSSTQNQEEHSIIESNGVSTIVKQANKNFKSNINVHEEHNLLNEITKQPMDSGEDYEIGSTVTGHLINFQEQNHNESRHEFTKEQNIGSGYISSNVTSNKHSEQFSKSKIKEHKEINSNNISLIQNGHGDIKVTGNLKNFDNPYSEIQNMKTVDKFNTSINRQILTTEQHIHEEQHISQSQSQNQTETTLTDDLKRYNNHYSKNQYVNTENKLNKSISEKSLTKDEHMREEQHIAQIETNTQTGNEDLTQSKNSDGYSISNQSFRSQEFNHSKHTIENKKTESHSLNFENAFENQEQYSVNNMQNAESNKDEKSEELCDKLQTGSDSIDNTELISKTQDQTHCQDTSSSSEYRNALVELDIMKSFYMPKKNKSRSTNARESTNKAAEEFKFLNPVNNYTTENFNDPYSSEVELIELNLSREAEGIDKMMTDFFNSLNITSDEVTYSNSTSALNFTNKSTYFNSYDGFSNVTASDIIPNDFATDVTEQVSSDVKLVSVTPPNVQEVTANHITSYNTKNDSLTLHTSTSNSSKIILDEMNSSGIKSHHRFVKIPANYTKTFVCKK